MKIGGKLFDTAHRTYVMGILNVTPDSFSDGGKWRGMDAALRHAQDMIDAGADLLDIGGESTRLGYTLLPDAEEIDRVAPVIEAVKREFDIPVSVDTYKSAVARAALAAGADLVNDIWGLQYDPDMAQVVAQAGVPCCLMHNRQQPVYRDFLRDVQDDLRACVRRAKEAGIADDAILLDPGIGIGFGKTLEHNLLLMNHLELLHELGYPLLLGTSRKSMIGNTLHLPVDQREEGTLATTVIGMMKGCAFVRVHDVQANRRAVDMTAAILRAGEEA